MKGEFVCTTCGYVGKPKKYTKGSCLVEGILWLCFFIPGLIYSLWRVISAEKVCPKCLKPTIIPVDTPRGQELLRKKK